MNSDCRSRPIFAYRPGFQFYNHIVLRRPNWSQTPFQCYWPDSGRAQSSSLSNTLRHRGRPQVWQKKWSQTKGMSAIRFARGVGHKESSPTFPGGEARSAIEVEDPTWKDTSAAELWSPPSSCWATSADQQSDGNVICVSSTHLSSSSHVPSVCFGMTSGGF